MTPPIARPQPVASLPPDDDATIVEIARLARRFAGDLATASAADDIAQDVVLYCLTEVREGRWTVAPAHLPACVRRLVFCRSVNVRHHQQRRSHREGYHLRALTEGVHAWMEPELANRERELDALRRQLVDSLPAAQRHVYVCIREYGMDYRTVAESLGITRSGVSANLVRAQKELRRLLEEAGVAVPPEFAGRGVRTRG